VWDSGKKPLNQVSEFLHATLEFFSADSLIIVRIKDLKETFGNTDVFYATVSFSGMGFCENGGCKSETILHVMVYHHVAPQL